MTIRVLKLMLVALALQAICIAQAREFPDEPTARTLTVSGVREISVPPFPYFQYPISDQDHNLYFHYDNGRFDSPVLLRISPRDSSAVMYKLSPEDSEIYMYGSAAVTASGEVWMVCSKEERGTYLFSFSSDAKPGTPTHLQIQNGFLAKSLVAFPAGRFLVSGYFGKGASKSLQGQRFLGIVDSSGKLIKELPSITAKTDLSAGVVRPPDDFAVVGSDGNAYFLGSEQIAVVNTAGEVIKTIQFGKPKGARGTRVFESSGGNLLVQITTLSPSGIHQNKYLLLDGYSGKAVATYETTSDLGNVAVDFSLNEGITFLKRDRSKLTLLTAELK